MLNNTVKKIIFWGVIIGFFSVFILRFTRLQFVLGGDIAWLINPFFLGSRFVWTSSNLGYYTVVNDILPIVTFYSFFKLFNLANQHIQTLYLFFAYFGSFATFYFILRKFLPQAGKLICVLASFFYVFNEFRLGVIMSDRFMPVAIFWPLMFYFYYRLLNTQELKYALLFPLFSIFYAGSHVNPPVVSVIYISLFFYLIYFLITEKLSFKKYVKIFRLNVLVGVLFLLVNVWWLPTFYLSTSEASDANAQVSQFRPLGTGLFYDHFRLIGQWGWYAGHYLYERYAPFSLNYDKPFLAVTTYLVALFPLLIIFKFKDKNFLKEKKDIKLDLFFLFIFLIGIFLANGTKHFLGKAFEFGYSLSKYFWIFREPWTKFTPLVVFSSSFLLGSTLSYFKQKIHGKKTYGLLFLSLSACLVINAYPFFTSGVVWDKWNGSMRSWRVVIPEYWNELKVYINQQNLGKERILVFPQSYYGMAFNWISGFSGFDPSKFILSNPVVGANGQPTIKSEFVINQIYSNLKNKNFNLSKYLSLLNLRYVVQENDVDWRFPLGLALSPSESNRVLKTFGFEKISEFGKFTPEYLSKIPNDEPDKKIHDMLYQELVNQPALVLYRMSDQYFVPQFYIPRKVYLVNGSIDRLVDIAGSNDYPVGSGIFFINKDEKANAKTAQFAEEIYLDAQPTERIEKKDVQLSMLNMDIPFSPDDLKKELESPFFPLRSIVNFYDRWRLRKDPKGLLEKEIFMTAKNVGLLDTAMERKSYKKVKQQISEYDKNVKQILTLLNQLKNSKDREFNYYWTKILNVFYKQKERILAFKQENCRIQAEEILSRAFVDLDGLELTERLPTFLVNIPQSGEYEVYSRDTKALEKNWHLVGVMNFKQGQQTLNLPSESLTDNLVDESLRISDYFPDSIYRMSFDYRSGGVADFAVEESKKGKVFQKNLLPTGNKIMNYSAYFLSTTEVDKANFFISVPEFENLTINRVLQPELMLRKAGIEKTKINISPQSRVDFTKINPTQYKVVIHHASGSFPLIFTEQFHWGWQARLEKENLASGPVNSLKKWFEDVFVIVSSKDSRMVKNEDHLSANGFANSWIIDTEDLCLKKRKCFQNSDGTWEINLQIEFWLQKLFNWGILISGLTFILCLVVLKRSYRRSHA